jgi:hypothetical protein
VAAEHQGIVKRLEDYLKAARADSEAFPIRPAPKTKAK